MKIGGEQFVGQVGTVVLCVRWWHYRRGDGVVGVEVAFRLFRTKWWYPAVMFGVVLVGVAVSGGDVAGAWSAVCPGRG